MNQEEKDELKYLVYKVDRLENILFKIINKLEIVYKD